MSIKSKFTETIEEDDDEDDYDIEDLDYVLFVIGVNLRSLEGSIDVGEKTILFMQMTLRAFGHDVEFNGVPDDGLVEAYNALCEDYFCVVNDEVVEEERVRVEDLNLEHVAETAKIQELNKEIEQENKSISAKNKNIESANMSAKIQYVSESLDESATGFHPTPLIKTKELIKDNATDLARVDLDDLDFLKEVRKIEKIEDIGAKDLYKLLYMMNSVYALFNIRTIADAMQECVPDNGAFQNKAILKFTRGLSKRNIMEIFPEEISSSIQFNFRKFDPELIP